MGWGMSQTNLHYRGLENVFTILFLTRNSPSRGEVDCSLSLAIVSALLGGPTKP